MSAAKAATAKAATAKPEALDAAGADCRAVLVQAIKERDEAGQRADALLEQLAEARTAFEAKEAAYLEVKEANQTTVGLPDEAVLAAFRREQELGSLAEAAKRLFDQTNASFDNARRQIDEGERAVRQAIGVLLATEGVTRASLFLDRWAELIDEAAALLALRAACEKLRTPIPYEFGKLFSLKQLDLASNDPRFVEGFQTARGNLAALVERLSNDAEAPIA
jgi:hypothetical protein